MSFGYAIGDFIAGAVMAHKLIQLMTTSSDACTEYQEAMKELRLIQQAFITVSQLGETEVALPRHTVNSASFLIMSSMDIISRFLKRTEHLKKSLSTSGPPAISDSWCKVGWALYGKEELRDLRDKLHNSLAALNLLFSAANYVYRPVPPPIAPFKVVDNDGYASESTCVDQEVVDLIQDELGTSPADPNAPETLTDFPTQLPKKRINSTTEGPKPAVPSPKKADDMSTKGTDAALLERLAHLEKLATEKTNWEANQAEWRKNVEDLARLKAEIQIREAEIALRSKLEAEAAKEEAAPILFQDALGRLYTFPFQSCKSFEQIHENIEQAFVGTREIGAHVHVGHYDLLSPSREIILPALWETTIKPGWKITMHMWDMDLHPLPGHIWDPAYPHTDMRPRVQPSEGPPQLVGDTSTMPSPAILHSESPPPFSTPLTLHGPDYKHPMEQSVSRPDASTTMRMEIPMTQTGFLSKNKFERRLLKLKARRAAQKKKARLGRGPLSLRPADRSSSSEDSCYQDSSSCEDADTEFDEGSDAEDEAGSSDDEKWVSQQLLEKPMCGSVNALHLSALSNSTVATEKGEEEEEV